MVTNAEFWNGLPADVRTTLEEILQQVTEEVNALARQKAIQDRQKAIAEGRVEITPLTDADREAWRKVLLPVWDLHADEIGRPLIDAARATGQTPGR